jgi:ubiquinone/menaquinone biosynthesis C-methylase UbiE
MAMPFAQKSFPDLYEQYLVEPLFRPWADPLLDAISLEPRDRLLDVACGTGIVARCARVRLGSSATVVGVDVNAGMLAVAHRIAPDVEWREGNATDLPLRLDEQFDVVCCQQGFQFLPDRMEAARQFRRALASNGRLGVSTWRPDDESEVLRALREIAERYVGPIDDRRHSLGDPAPLEAVLREVGLRDVRSRTQSRTIRFQDGAAFVRLNAMALIGMSAAAKDLTDSDRERLLGTVVRESAALIADHTDASGFAYTLGANVTTATA